MKRWQQKVWLGKIFGKTRLSYKLYRYLTNNILKKQKLAPWKWCQWFREHILLCKRHAGLNPSLSRIWLFDPGWTITPGILARLTTENDVFATDRSVRLKGVYNKLSVKTVLDNLKALGKTYRLSQVHEDLLSEIADMGSAKKVFKKLEIPYYAPAEKFNPLNHLQEKVDICMSMGVLEHYSPETLDNQIKWMHSLLRTGGAATHIIDHRDHFWHADSSICPFEMLYYSDLEWQKIADNRLNYCNRLLQPDYVELFEKNGFDIVYLGSKPYPEDAVPVDRDRLWGRYKEVSDEIFKATVSHIVAVKR